MHQNTVKTLWSKQTMVQIEFALKKLGKLIQSIKIRLLPLAIMIECILVTNQFKIKKNLSKKTLWILRPDQIYKIWKIKLPDSTVQRIPASV